jgi:hypothetical protein
MPAIYSAADLQIECSGKDAGTVKAILDTLT